MPSTHKTEKWRINHEMITLARDYRGFNQSDAARALNMSQGKISKIEGGLVIDISNDDINKFSEFYKFPVDFFYQKEPLFSIGSSAYFYRKKAEVSANEKKKIHSLINLLRIHVKILLKNINISIDRRLPRWSDQEQYSSKPEHAANTLRAFWKLPDGPINNITELLESAGIIIIPCDFGTNAMDATSIWISETPPLIFINKNIPGDRWRFTLAHELGHLILHDFPKDEMEDEADRFASEFLMPKEDILPFFSRKISLDYLSSLKSFWKTSIQSLLIKSHQLKKVTDNQYRYFWMVLSQKGYRLEEPNPILKEEISAYKELIIFYKTDLGYEIEDLALLLKLKKEDYIKLYEEPKKNLKIIKSYAMA